MDNNLIFEETLTVEQFKDVVKVSKLDVKRNPKTGKIFFSYGSRTGAVSAKGIPSNPMISLVHPKGTQLDVANAGKPECSTFYILHEEGNGGAPVLATL